MLCSLVPFIFPERERTPLLSIPLVSTSIYETFVITITYCSIFKSSELQWARGEQSSCTDRKILSQPVNLVFSVLKPCFHAPVG